MKIILHIGMEHCGAERVQEVMDQKRDQLMGKGILYAGSPGRKNHTRLYMAVSDPDHVDQLRFARGFTDPAKQKALYDKVVMELRAEVERFKPKVLILSASQLGAGLSRESELRRLKALLNEFSKDIRVVAHLDEQARVLTRHYAEAVWSGRRAGLDQELKLAGAKDWRKAALAARPEIRGETGDFEEVQAPPFWLDYKGLQAAWEKVFGKGSVTFRAYDEELFYGKDVTTELSDAFDLPKNIGKARAAEPPGRPSAPWITRGRMLNEVLAKLCAKGRSVPRQQWRGFMREIFTPGAPIEPGCLSKVSSAFEPDNKALVKAHRGLSAACLRRDKKLKDWSEADPEKGYRATQYGAALLPRIARAAAAEKQAQKRAETSKAETLSPTAEKLLTPLAKANYDKLKGGPMAPHNRLGAVNEAELGGAFAPMKPRKLPKGSSGNVIVGCMKNEGPYILEWVAYHRAIGFDNFLIYTNGCEDGTVEILDRLQEMGIVQHRDNDNWKGNSPQQYALNQSLKEDVIKNADWIAHIDVDEFVNIRCGNGTVQDFLDAVPDATNVAMTWRLFGHNGVEKFEDKLVVEQFDAAAPKFCPKPHTVWGFKTLFRNIGAYEKISCHRPTKLKNGKRGKVNWVNGSGHPMGESVKDNGWRSSVKSIGYDLIQLNHYALRSAESFLIKRQRGRALHVDRSIGLNYWVRMDWSDYRDITIKRNIPRLTAELERLKADKALKKHHENAVAWHRAKADELHGQPEFQDLYAQALETRLGEMERVAYALALDVES